MSKYKNLCISQKSIFAGVNDNKNIILFDGVCNLCNGFVQFVIKRDKNAVFKFASLQSETGQEVLRKYNLPIDELTSVIYVQNENVFLRSEAALRIASQLDGIWKLSKILLVFPTPLRDFVYNLVAKNRYRIFGKRDECMLPTAELKSRFL